MSVAYLSAKEKVGANPQEKKPRSKQAENYTERQGYKQASNGEGAGLKIPLKLRT